MAVVTSKVSSPDNGVAVAGSGGANAVLLGVELTNSSVWKSCDMAELSRLAAAAGLTPVIGVVARRYRLDSNTFVGTGKCEELVELLRTHDASVIIVGHSLRASQQHRLAQLTKAVVIDRHGLILRIFADRARSALGKLQVEYAQKNYELSRLVRGWEHLDRQRGGTRTAGGMGEMQLEVDRRLVRRRLNVLRKQLDRHNRRSEQNAERRRFAVPTISLVGYTNAGKSTLFSRLTKSKVPASQRMFETLDTTSRRADLGGGFCAVVSDTVGFVSDLPHSLVDAFSTTLNEALSTNLLALVVDSSDPEMLAKLQCVENILDDIGAGKTPRLLVLAKADLRNWGSTALPSMYDKIRSFSVSAADGSGVGNLRAGLLDRIQSQGWSKRDSWHAGIGNSNAHS